MTVSASDIAFVDVPDRNYRLVCVASGDRLIPIFFTNPGMVEQTVADNAAEGIRLDCLRKASETVPQATRDALVTKALDFERKELGWLEDRHRFDDLPMIVATALRDASTQPNAFRAAVAFERRIEAHMSGCANFGDDDLFQDMGHILDGIHKVAERPETIRFVVEGKERSFLASSGMVRLDMECVLSRPVEAPLPTP